MTFSLCQLALDLIAELQLHTSNIEKVKPLLHFVNATALTTTSDV